MRGRSWVSSCPWTNCSIARRSSRNWNACTGRKTACPRRDSTQNTDKAGDKLYDTQILRTIINTTPNLKRYIDEMERVNIKYYLYDIAEVHNILEASRCFRSTNKSGRSAKDEEMNNNNKEEVRDEIRGEVEVIQKCYNCLMIFYLHSHLIIFLFLFISLCQ